MSLLLRIAERALNRPLLIHPDKVPLILGVLEGRLPVGDVTAWRDEAEARIDQLPEDAQRIMRGPQSSRFVGDSTETDPETGRPRYLPYKRTVDGVAIITITGTLINRGAFIGSSSGETSYEGIKYQVGRAVADPRAAAILLDIESPGGEAVGAMEAAAAIREARTSKPVYAVVNGMAASAAYAIASGATKIIATPTSITGSIGVVLVHADYSRSLDKKGITPTLIFAGAHKVDGNPFEPLPADVRDDLKAEVDQYYDLFVDTVEQGRRPMTADAIRKTEARTFIGIEAVKVGLADAVGTFETALAELSTKAKARIAASQRRSMTMSTPSNPETETPVQEPSPTPATVQEPSAQAVAARIEAILNLPEAEGREALAKQLAFKTSLSVEDAKATLTVAPKAAVEQPRRMGNYPMLEDDPEPTPASAKAGWDKSIAKCNARRGFAS